ncbi:hypothetical protein [Planktothricoides raciborskii]|nr:hypothetical protein [Planktothricoides raciborskii]
MAIRPYIFTTETRFLFGLLDRVKKAVSGAMPSGLSPSLELKRVLLMGRNARLFVLV